LNTEKITSDFFASIKQQLIKEIMDELRPAISVELDQRRLSVREAAQYTRMSEDTVRTLCRENRIPHIRAGSANSKKPIILFRIDSLDKWLLQQEQINCPGWK
jgi:excisionase family DNA binding protein